MGVRELRVLEELADDLADVPGSREALRMVLEHLADGGIVIRHAGDYVLTWPDGGMSRRLAAGHWG